jgi:hypothetical protein
MNTKEQEEKACISIVEILKKSIKIFFSFASPTPSVLTSKYTRIEISISFIAYL